MNKLNRKTVGIISISLGGLFFLAGVVLFILLNWINLYAQKTEATIITRYDIEDSEEPYTFLELCYRVGGSMVTTTDSFHIEIPEDTITIDIYYDIRNPKILLQAGWNFYPLGCVAAGVPLVLAGLYYLNIFTFGIEERKKPGSNASKFEIEFYEAREKMENGYVPLFGAVCFVIFGLVMLIMQKGWWAWIFVGVGMIVIIYISMEIVPLTSKYLALKKIKKINGKVINVDRDFDNFEKSKSKTQKTVNKKEDFMVDDFEEPFEIKKIDKNKRKKK